MDLIRYCLDFTSGSPKIVQHDFGAYVRFEQAYSTIEGYKAKVERLTDQVGIAESTKQNVLKENRLLNERVDSLVFTNSSVHRENNNLQRENEELKEKLKASQLDLQVERETHHVTESGLNEVLDELKECKGELSKLKSNENQLVSDFLKALEVGMLQGSREDRIRKLITKIKVNQAEESFKRGVSKGYTLKDELDFDPLLEDKWVSEHIQSIKRKG